MAEANASISSARFDAEVSGGDAVAEIKSAPQQNTKNKVKMKKSSEYPGHVSKPGGVYEEFQFQVTANINKNNGQVVFPLPQTAAGAAPIMAPQINNIYYQINLQDGMLSLLSNMMSSSLSTSKTTTSDSSSIDDKDTIAKNILELMRSSSSVSNDDPMSQQQPGGKVEPLELLQKLMDMKKTEHIRASVRRRRNDSTVGSTHRKDSSTLLETDGPLTEVSVAMGQYSTDVIQSDGVEEASIPMSELNAMLNDHQNEVEYNVSEYSDPGNVSITWKVLVKKMTVESDVRFGCAVPHVLAIMIISTVGIVLFIVILSLLSPAL